jgi:hypothetical protein
MDVQDEIAQALLARIKQAYSMPESGFGEEIERLAPLWNPEMNISYEPARPDMEGKWFRKSGRTGIIFYGQPRPATKRHEFAHDLQYQTGIGSPLEARSSNAPYQFGAVPERIAEGAADLASGTLEIYPGLSLAEKSQANSIAKMMMAAAREHQSQAANQKPSHK